MKHDDLDSLNPAQLQKMVLDYLDIRFGLQPELFVDYGFYMASKGRVYLGPKRLIDTSQIVTLGLLVARISGAVKPSTNLLQLFGSSVQKNVIILTKDQTITYAKGEDLRLEDSQSSSCDGDGYVLLRYEKFSLGCGMLQGRFVRNLLPKAKRLELKFV